MQDGGSEIVLGVVAAPGTPAAVAGGLAEEMPAPGPVSRLPINEATPPKVSVTGAVGMKPW